MEPIHPQARPLSPAVGRGALAMPFTLDEVWEILLVEAERIVNSREEAETLASDALAEAIVHYGAPKNGVAT